MEKEYFCHESAIIDKGAVIGRGTKVWHFCHVMGKSKLGKNCILGQNVFVADDVTLGNNVKVQNNVSIYSGVSCEDDVFLGPRACLIATVFPGVKLRWYSGSAKGIGMNPASACWS